MKNNLKSLHYVYIVLCLLTGEYYFGKHSTNNKNDGYGGSGSELNKRKKELGKQHFTITLFARFESEKEAYDREEDLIRHFISDVKCLNKRISARGVNCDHAAYVYPSGKIAQLHIHDPDVLNGKAVHVRKGSVPWNKEKKHGYGIYILNNENLRLHKEDPLVLSGEAVHINKGRKNNFLKTLRSGKEPWNKGKKTNKPSHNRIIFSKEESDFINKLHCLGKSPFQIRKPFNEKFNKNISRDALYTYIKNTPILS